VCTYTVKIPICSDGCVCCHRTTTIVPVGVLLNYIWCHLMERPPVELLEDSTYPVCVNIMLLSCTIELFSEVPYIIAELQLWSKTRVCGIYYLKRCEYLSITKFI